MKYKITVKGLVQGIGFRPFVAELAEEYHIEGWVRNTAGIVIILAEQEKSVLEEFKDRLITRCPKGAMIDQLDVTILDSNPNYRGEGGFAIVTSEDANLDMPMLPADLPTCPRCENELRDPANRRYRHPFISCVACGPRYSIIKELPYDRGNITMGDFVLCPSCEAEYKAKGDVRRHAQTIACKQCGPKLDFILLTQREDELDQERHNFLSFGFEYNNEEQIDKRERFRPGHGTVVGRDSAINEAEFRQGIELLRQGGILAIKDIGGFHLACRADDEQAVSALRALKGREKKPFALMYGSVQDIMEDCQVSEREGEELISNPRPVVLLKKRQNGKHVIAKNVCGNSPDIGAMLPCNPLQWMLMDAWEGQGPLIMTSANASGEPMIIEANRLHEWVKESLEANAAMDVPSQSLAHVEIGMWTHYREILIPLDDAVVRIVRGRRQVVRRGRGMVPTPVELGEDFALGRTVLAMGGDLKATCAYAQNRRVVLSGQMGDLADEACKATYEAEVKRMGSLLYAHPDLVVVDAHPRYLSAAYGRDLVRYFEYEKNRFGTGHCLVKLVPIQHHKAHVASVVAEHGLQGEVIGVAFDGTGYGEDGTIWGGEIFVMLGDCHIERVSHLKQYELPGGDAGAKNAESMAYAYLADWMRDSFNSTDNEDKEKLLQQFFQCADWLSAERYQLVKAALAHHVNTVKSTSAGRLFDAVSALLGICLWNDYEGEAPMELEYLAGQSSSYSLTMDGLVEQVVRGVIAGVDRGQIAHGFIDALAGFIYDEVISASRYTDTKQVALSGGTFLNRILTERLVDLLEEAGYQVYMNEQVPTGDGGIALGQVFLSRKE